MLGHLSYERSSSMLYVDGMGLVIIGQRSSKSTFGAYEGNHGKNE